MWAQRSVLREPLFSAAAGAALAALLLLASAFGTGAREPQLYVSNELPNTI